MKNTKKQLINLMLLGSVFNLSAMNNAGYMPISQEASNSYIAIDIEALNSNQCIGKPITIQDVANKHLITLIGKNDPKIPNSTMGDPVKFVERQKAILLNVPERVKKNAAFKILGKDQKTNKINSIIDQTTWTDLDLLCSSGKNPEKYLGSILNRTSTELGKAYFLGMISRPISNKNILEKRQDIVKELVYNPSITNQLNENLNEMKDCEPQLLSFWDNALTLPGCIHNQYWKFNKKLDEFLNNKALALDIKSFWTNLQKVTGTAIQTSSTVLLTAYALSLTGLFETPEFLQEYATRFTGTSGPIYALISLVHNRVTSGAASLAAGVVTGLSLESTIKWTKADLSIDAIVQKKLLSVAKYYKQMKNICHLVSYSGLEDKLTNFEDLNNFINNKELDNLFSVLESNTFNSEGNYLFRRGNVLLLYKLLQEENIKNEFEKALAAIAEIDSYVSVAKLFNEFTTKNVKFCFPTFVENGTPLVKAEDFWNPFVDTNSVVTNSIKLGESFNTPNIIITGPNSAGKSTIMKSMLAIILAQSIGIAPAKSMTLTPFAHMATYMDITDDIGNKTSLFQSEVDRAINLLDTIQKLPKGGFSFTMFDELFSGTSPEEGMAMAYATAEEIGNQPNSICMIATHYRLLTELESGNRFKNYKVAVEQNDNAPIKRLYKLESGISDQHIAFDVARERGSKNAIIENARNILKRIRA